MASLPVRDPIGDHLLTRVPGLDWRDMVAA